MPKRNIGFSLSYEGQEADDHEIDLYDLSRAMMGFERSLAITAHLFLNGEIITQAPSLRGARLLARPAEEGSYKLWAFLALLGTGIYNFGTADKDTVLGHLMMSGYDYIVSETLGFHVDYDKTLGVLYEEHQTKNGKLPLVVQQSQLDSALEKCENSIREMHRPLAFSETATIAKISGKVNQKIMTFDSPLTRSTFDYMSFTTTGEAVEEFEGYITSYNKLTFKGRVYLPLLRRPVSFWLNERARGLESIHMITSSLHFNAQDRIRNNHGITLVAFTKLSRSRQVKSLDVVEIKELNPLN